MATVRSTAFKGIAKSRKGSPAISLQTIIDRSMRKKAEVSREEAREAKKVLKQPKSALRYLDAGLVSGAASPLINAAGRATEAAIDAKKGRWGAARRALTDTTRGGVAKNVVHGTLLGTGISAAREGVATARAKNTYNDFLKQTGHKSAGLLLLANRLRGQGFNPVQAQEDEARQYIEQLAEDAVKPIQRKEKVATEAFIEMAKTAFGIPNPPKPKPSVSAAAGAKAETVGRFKGTATENSLKPPGPAVSKLAINPRRSIPQAINAFRS